MMGLKHDRLPGHHGGLHASRELATKIGADLAAVESLAPHIFILERDETGPPIYDHAGCGVQLVIGSDPRGKTFYDYWSTEARAALESCFAIAAKRHLAFRLFSIGLQSKAPAMEVETTLIPVTAADAGKSR